MLPDPLTTATGFATNPGLPAVSREQNKSVYSRVTPEGGDYDVTISHEEKKGRRRSVVRLDLRQVKSDPYVTNQNVDDHTTAYLVIDRSMRLSTDAQVIGMVKELLGVLELATSTNVITTRLAKVVAGES